MQTGIQMFLIAVVRAQLNETNLKTSGISYVGPHLVLFEPNENGADVNLRLWLNASFTNYLN